MMMAFSFTQLQFTLFVLRHFYFELFIRKLEVGRKFFYNLIKVNSNERTDTYVIILIFLFNSDHISLPEYKTLFLNF